MEDKLDYMNDQHHLEWHESLELIFSELLDESQVRAFFHKKSHEYYSKENIKYQLPIIIFSAIAGSGNFISSTFPTVQQYIILGVGGLSIGTSIISSISQFLKLSQLSEGHRIAYLSWEKFYANIKLQLRRKKADRDDIKDFMNNITAEYQRLKEISPEIPPHIACLIKKNRRMFNENGIQVPFIFDKFQHISAYNSEQEAARIKRRMSYRKRPSAGATSPSDDDFTSDSMNSSTISSKSLSSPKTPGIWGAVKSYCVSKLGNTTSPNVVPFDPPVSTISSVIPKVSSNIEELNENVKATYELIFKMQNEIQSMKTQIPQQQPQALLQPPVQPSLIKPIPIQQPIPINNQETNVHLGEVVLDMMHTTESNIVANVMSDDSELLGEMQTTLINMNDMNVYESSI
jgi:hypothetical protein